MEHDNKKEEHQKWPRLAMQEVCNIKRLGRVPLNGSTKHTNVLNHPGDILLVQVGDGFRASVCDGNPMDIQGPFALLAPSEKIMPEFLTMTLERESFFKTLKSRPSGGVFAGGKLFFDRDFRDNLGSVNISVPPLDEQARVVLNSEKYLTHVQGMASNFRRLADTLDKLHTALSGEMMQRKMEKKEIVQHLSGLCGLFPRGSQQEDEVAGQPVEEITAAAKPSRTPGP